jgi:hypothetical protein
MVHINTRNPFGSRLILAGHRLLLKIVLVNSSVGTGKEMRLGGVERDCLDDTFTLRERPLTIVFTQRVDHDLTRGLNIVSHSREVVSFGMPYKLSDNIVENKLVCVSISSTEVLFDFPLDEFLFKIVRSNFN